MIERRAGYRLVCTGCERSLGEAFVPFCPDCGAMSDVRYDLAAVELRDSPNPYLRFIDLLPVVDSTLLPDDAQYTPCVHATRLGELIGLPSLYLKDETKLPTGTTKDRMAAVALPFLRERGVTGFTTSSTGNSSSAYAYALPRVPRLLMYLFTAAAFRDRLALPPHSDRAVDVVLDDATFVEAFAAAGDFARGHGLVAEQGFFNAGRREGLKTAWLEAVEQVPGPIDWYVQAVSSAMGVYGVYKAARELHQLEVTGAPPRLLCVQQETCAPMVSAWRRGSERIGAEDIVERPIGIAAAILRGDPSRTYPHVRGIVHDSGGMFAAVSEHEIRAAHQLLEEVEGISSCFAASAAVAGLTRARREGAIEGTATVLVNVSGSDRPGTPPDADTYWVRRHDGAWDLSLLARGVDLEKVAETKQELLSTQRDGT